MANACDSNRRVAAYTENEGALTAIRAGLVLAGLSVSLCCRSCRSRRRVEAMSLGDRTLLCSRLEVEQHRLRPVRGGPRCHADITFR